MLQVSVLWVIHSLGKWKAYSSSICSRRMPPPRLAADSHIELVNAGYAGDGVKIPVLGLGVYQVPEKSAVDFALKHGYRHIDTAHLYMNERAVGTAVKKGTIPREEVFVTTKLWNDDQGYRSTLKAFDRSLKELGFDYVDLYLIHSPLPKSKRLDTWKAMEEILRSGKAKSIGVSNYGIHHLKELFANCTIRPSINQIEIHPFNTRQELAKFCKQENIVVEAYSPLTQGKRLNHPTLVEIATSYNKTPAQVLIRWGLQKDYVEIPKSVTPSRIIENSQVFDFDISESDMKKLDSLDENLVVGWDPTTAP